MNLARHSTVVVKIGGSLFGLPDFGARLEWFLSGLETADVVLVPGGGPAADLVRGWDRDFGLGEERAHWLALRALALNAHFLASVVPNAQVIERLDERRLLLAGVRPIMDMHAWALVDECSPGHLPHSWQVTSDSLAARLAMKSEAAKLILLKSVDFRGHDWRQAAQAGVVDPFFPQIMDRTGPGLHVRLVNLRTYAMNRAPAGD
jgi:aspartokinase-like uncharacterized kinase